MEKFFEVFAYFNPIFLYYSLIYGGSKIYQNIFNIESVWGILWNKYMNIFGDAEAFHIIWLTNFYGFFLYWILGAVLMTMQKLKIPKSLENFKIQAKESEIEKSENLIKVRTCLSSYHFKIFFFLLRL